MRIFLNYFFVVDHNRPNLNKDEITNFIKKKQNTKKLQVKITRHTVRGKT